MQVSGLLARSKWAIDKYWLAKWKSPSFEVCCIDKALAARAVTQLARKFLKFSAFEFRLACYQRGNSWCMYSFYLIGYWLGLRESQLWIVWRHASVSCNLNWQWVGRLSERPVLKHGPRSLVWHWVDWSWIGQFVTATFVVVLRRSREIKFHVILWRIPVLREQHVSARVPLLQH